MATTSTPTTARRKTAPKTDFLYRDLRSVCLEAIQGEPCTDRKMALEQILLMKALEHIRVIKHFNEAGVLPAAISNDMVHDVRLVYEELRNQLQNSAVLDARLQFLIIELQDIKSNGTVLAPF